MDMLVSAKLDARIEAFLKGAKFEVSAPRFDSGEDQDDGSKPWPNVAWDIKIVSKEGRVVHAFPYRSGLACIEKALRTLYKRGALAFAKEEVANVAYNICERRKYITQMRPGPLKKAVEYVLLSKERPAPDLRSVLFSILSDGTACFNRQSFREWCLDFGFSTDSLRAWQRFNTCYDTGAALAVAFGAEACEKMLEAFYEANF